MKSNEKKNNNKMNKYFGIAVICLFIAMVFFWINKSTYSVTEKIISVTCDEVIRANDYVKCQVEANFNTMTVKSINANYKIPDELEYVSFGVEDNGYEVYASTSNGFAIINEKGNTGNFKVGTIILKAKEDVVSNEKIVLELKDIEVSDVSIKIHDIDDISTTLRVANNDNTLRELILSNNIKLNPVFSKDTLEYNIKVDSDVEKITIIANSSDDKAIVTGNINNEMKLKYGINTFLINVMPENKNQEEVKTYTVKINRDYEFSSSKYIYNKERNYLYTRNDITEEQIIASLDVLPEGMNYSIEDDKLIIRNLNEKLMEIDIINFKLDNHIENKKIYIEENSTYQDLTSKIVVNDVEIVITDNLDSTISAGEIKNIYKFKVYDSEGSLLEVYNFDMNYLNFKENLVIDKDKGIIKRIVAGTKYSELLEKIETSGKIVINSSDGSVVEDMSDIIKTKDKIKIVAGGVEHIYILSVLGDLTGDGKIEINDVSRLFRYYMGRVIVDDVEIASGEIINDGVLELNDVSRLFRYYMGRVTSLEGKGV